MGWHVLVILLAFGESPAFLGTLGGINDLLRIRAREGIVQRDFETPTQRGLSVGYGCVLVWALEGWITLVVVLRSEGYFPAMTDSAGEVGELVHII